MSQRRNNLLPKYCVPGQWAPSLARLSAAERADKKRRRKLAESRNRKRRGLKNQRRESETNGLPKSSDSARWSLFVQSFPLAQQDHAGRISAELEENDPRVLASILALLSLLDEREVDAIKQEALGIQNAGGELVNDRSRKRTVGGIFFRIARAKVGGDMNGAIRKLLIAQANAALNQPDDMRRSGRRVLP